MRTFQTRQTPMDPPLRPEKRGVIAGEGPRPHRRWVQTVVGLGHRPRGFEAPAGSAPGCSQGANWAKTASTGPPSQPRHDPPPERPSRAACAVAPEVEGAPNTQQRPAASWNSAWPSTNSVCSKSWAWPGRRPAPSGAEVAWRSWSYCRAPNGHQVQRRAVMRAMTWRKVWKSRPASDGAWPSPLRRKSAGRHGPGGTWKAKPMAILPKTVRARALALLGRLTDGGYISWRPDTLGLIVDGIEHKGTNLVDLAGHVVRQRQPGNRRC